MADDMNPSGSDDDDEIVSDDDGELPAPLPLSMLGAASSGKKPKPTPKLPTPLRLARKPPSPGLPSSKPVAVSKPVALTGTTNGHEEIEEVEEAPAPTETTPAAAAAATTSTASPTNEASNQDSDDDDDDGKITTPASMPPHRAIAEPVAEEECASDPFDAAKAAEQARKAATGPGTSVSSGGGGGGGGGAVATPPAERSPGVVDEALLSLLLMLKGEKNDSLAQVPMHLCVHGLVKDDEGNTWPPYEISLPESRKSQTSRQSWLNQRMQEDPNRLLNTILFFNIDPDAVLDSKSVMSASDHKLQAILPGVLVNPDGNADASKRIAEYNESIGTNEWTFAIPVPSQFVKLLYKQHKHGLPTLYNPVSNDKVKFSLFSKIEDQCVKDSRWKLVVDKSRDGQAVSGGGGRGKRAAGGGEEVSKKRSKIIATAAAAESPGEEHVEEAIETPPPAPTPVVPTPAPTPAPPPAVQTMLNFLPTAVVANGTGSDVEASLEPQIPKTQLALCPANDSTPSMVHAPLSWTSLTPDWFSIIVPKIPPGFVVEMSAPTVHCCGMLSLKRSAKPIDNPLDF
jgi:hypothetical protein